MLKRFVVGLLTFVSGLAGNLLAGWLQNGNSVASGSVAELLVQERIVGTLAGSLLMLIVLAALETDRMLTWNWRWHRFWYLCELLSHQSLARWKNEFIQLRLTRSARIALRTKVTRDGATGDLTDTVQEIFRYGRKHNRIRFGIHLIARLMGKGPAGRAGEMWVPKALITGEPGSGKTTSMERLTLELARVAIWKVGSLHPIPVLIRLGNFQAGTLLEYIRSQVQLSTAGRSGSMLAKGIDRLLERGHVALLFDALDEALGAHREVVLSELTMFTGSPRYAHVPTVVTVRERQDPGERLPVQNVLEIEDLNDEAVEAFVRMYKPPETKVPAVLLSLQEAGLLEPDGLGRNPFWLQLIVQTGVFHGLRGQMIDQSIDEVLKREWEKPITARAWHRVFGKEEQLRETKRVLAWLGYWMTNRGTVALDLTQALDCIAEWLNGQVALEQLRPQDVLEMGRDARLVVYRGEIIQFRHRLVQEFLTAWALEHLPVDHDAFIRERVLGDTGLWEVVLMLGDLLEDRSALIQSILQADSGLSGSLLGLALAGTAGGDLEGLKPEILSRISDYFQQASLPKREYGWSRFATLVQHRNGTSWKELVQVLLAMDNLEARRIAIDMLSYIRTEEAAEFLIRYLDDPVVGRAAKLAVELIGAQAIRPLERALIHPRNEVGQRASEALAFIGVPALPVFEAALQNSDPKIRFRAASALAYTPGQWAVDILISATRDGDEDVRRVAVGGLGRSGNTRAVNPLMRLLVESSRDWKPHVIGTAAWQVPSEIPPFNISNIAMSLAHIGGDAVQPCVALLRHARVGTRAAAALALAAIGAPALQPLLRSLRACDEGERACAAYALRDAGPSVAGALLEALGDSAESVRQTAARSLGRIGAPVIAPLVEALQHGTIEVRISAAWALSYAIQYARAKLNADLPPDDAGSERGAAQTVMQIVSATGGIEALLLTLDNPEPALREAAATALAWVQPPPLSALAKMLRAEEPIAGAALVALIRAETAGIPVLLDALRQEGERVAARAASALSIIGQPALGALLDTLWSSAPKTQVLVAVALSQIGEPAVEPLVNALTGRDDHKGNAAVLALISMGSRSLEPLLQALRNDNWAVRARAAIALGLIGDQQAAHALREAACDPVDRVAQCAEEALTKLAAGQSLSHPH